MIYHRKKHTCWFALLSVGAALVFLWCHTLAAETHTGEGIGILQMVETAPAFMNGHDLDMNARSMDCRAALSGAKAFTGKHPLSSATVSVAALFPFPLPIQPAWEALHAAPTVTAPHRTTLQHQAVLIRI